MGFDYLGLLGFSVFSAACLQSATGIGYGVIAGPLFLVILNDNQAFQLSTIHNLAIALILAPYVWKDINRMVLKNFLLGGSFGLFIGFIIYVWSSVSQLKFAAVLMVAFVTTVLLRETVYGSHDRTRKKTAFLETTLAGTLAGIMGGMLAMPGPIAAAWMSIKGLTKKEIRATVLTFFLFAYGANTTLYTITTGLSSKILLLSVTLFPPMLFGIVVGTLLSKILNERVFRFILLGILICTICTLIFDLVEVYL